MVIWDATDDELKSRYLKVRVSEDFMERCRDAARQSHDRAGRSPGKRDEVSAWVRQVLADAMERKVQ